MKILFHENELNYRGQSTALYDYAHFNEEFLGNESVIIHNPTLPTNHPLGVEKFKSRFEVLEYRDPSELNSIIEKGRFDLFYNIKNGFRDGIEPDACPSAVHAVFKYNEPHGDVYAYVSQWLSQEMTQGNSPFVPHMVHFNTDTDEDLRSELGIPKTARVYGYYGGAESFNIGFVQHAVEEIARRYKDVYFIFMGVNHFIREKWWKSKIKNVIFLPPSGDMLRKIRFINTCNALLHARKRGETFGITVAEFAMRGRPVVAFADVPERAHLTHLGDSAYLYRTKNELKSLLLDGQFSPTPEDRFAQFLPKPVMECFKNVFIKDLKKEKPSPHV